MLDHTVCFFIFITALSLTPAVIPILKTHQIYVKKYQCPLKSYLNAFFNFFPFIYHLMFFTQYLLSGYIMVILLIQVALKKIAIL